MYTLYALQIGYIYIHIFTNIDLPCLLYSSMFAQVQCFELPRNGVQSCLFTISAF